MQVTEISYDRNEARRMVDLYRKHRNAETDVDVELRRIYYQIGRGRKVIAALASIGAAGGKPDGMPQLAICPAHFQRVECVIDGRGGADFHHPSRYSGSRGSLVVSGMPVIPNGYKRGTAIVPYIPLHLRPTLATLPTYHILFEAEWKNVVPVDPMLLKRIGKDAWVVVAAWDLTPLERHVLQSRMPV